MPFATSLIAVLALLAVPLLHGTTTRAAGEVRALWVTRATLVSPVAVRQMVRSAQMGGFNTLLVQVRGRGDAYYRSSFDPRATELAAHPDFDPLAAVLAEARPAGLQVHAWINVNLVSSAVRLPVSKQHVIYRQPEWLMVPRDLASDMLSVDPSSPEYVGRLARWTRAHNAEVEGLYTSPVHSGVAAYVANLASELVSRYAVDGVHLDYVRFPNADFDYSRVALQQFKDDVRPQLAASERRQADAQDRIDPLAYTSLYPGRWNAFRRSRLTTLVMRVRTAVKAANPRAVLSAAVVPDASVAASAKLQDWRTWVDSSLIDVLCPMAYTPQIDGFEQQIAATRRYAADRPVWAGVGAYRLSPTATLRHIAAARRHGAAGVILFSYDALIAPPNSIASLTELGRAAFSDGSQ